MMPRAVVIVQARWGSSRLPGKVLCDLQGRTVLRRVLERCKAIKGVECVCCAVPSSEANDGVAREAAGCGAAVVRGSEDDVLGRYYQAAKELQAGIVVRVTSDCPLLDPEVTADVLRLIGHDVDYACNNMPPSWPHGLDCEAFTYEWLEKAALEASLPSEREHVTPFIRKHDCARKLVLHAPVPGLGHYRWTLDTEKDLIFLRALFERLPEGPEWYGYRHPLAILERDPALCDLNAGQDRNAGLKRSIAADEVFRKS